VSADIAQEIQTRCDIEGNEVPEHIRDFVESHVEGAKSRQPGAAVEGLGIVVAI
jgi:hypothetical protein